VNDTTTRPTLQVRGAPTDEELTAVVAVLSALGAPTADAPPRRTPSWSAPSRLLRRTPLERGWRASALPR
jgi:hypothetical protein